MSNFVIKAGAGDSNGPTDNRQLRVERGGQRQRAYEWRLSESECGESSELIPHGSRAGAHTCAHARTHARGGLYGKHSHSLTTLTAGRLPPFEISCVLR